MDHPWWGYRMIRGLLAAEGRSVNEKRVEGLPLKVKESGLRAITLWLRQ